QSATSYKLPQGASLQLGVGVSTVENIEDLLRFLSGYISTHKMMTSDSEARPEIKNNENFERIFSSLLSRRSIFRPIWIWAIGRYCAAEAVVNLFRAVEQLANGTLNRSPALLGFLKEFYKLPAEPTEILHGQTALSTLGSSVLEAALTRANNESTPLGFWP